MTMEELAAHIRKVMPPITGCRLLVALSGGADSVALTAALCTLRKEEQLTLFALHVNHGLRGAESDGDQAFVEDLCAQYNLPLQCIKLNPPKSAGETWAREARYAALLQAAREKGCTGVVLAHHQDDQAETLLEHLLRGCGPEGLGGMRPVSRRGEISLLRPLLQVSRAQLREALRGACQDWREDATNAQADCLRNKLRLQVMPLLESLSPGAGAHMAAAAALQGEEQATLTAWEDAFLRKWDTGWQALPLKPLKELPLTMRSRVLRHWWQNMTPDASRLDRAQTNAWVMLLDKGAGARCNLPGGWHGEGGNGFLHVVPPQRPTPSALSVCEAQGTYVLGGVTLCIRPWQAMDGTGDGKLVQTLPAELLQACTLRTRQRGDWMKPFGGGGRKRLQDVLVDRKVDAAFRDRIPLLCRENEVLLIAGVAAGNVPPLDEKESLLSLRWLGDMPWTAEDASGRGEGQHGTECKAVW